jgi:hypothetical protein
MTTSANEVSAQIPHQAVPLDVWQRLYATSTKVREMEPWLWLEETDIFGVKDPESDTVLFVSVMGLMGEYLAVALYPGAKALAHFWQMQAQPEPEETAGMVLEIRQIHAAFGKKSELDAREKKVVKELGLTFRGTNVWPYFRSFMPGYFPWVIDAEEARLLILALEQLLVVAPRVKEDRRLVARKSHTANYFVRVPHQQAGAIEWRDEHHDYPPPASSFRITIPIDVVNAVRAMTPSDLTVEMDVAQSHFPIGKKGERLQIPWMMLAAEPQSHFILGVELLAVKENLEDMWMQVPAKFLQMIVKHGIRPQCLALRTPWVEMVMQGICKDLGIEIKRDPKLRAVTQARKSLERLKL